MKFLKALCELEADMEERDAATPTAAGPARGRGVAGRILASLPFPPLVLRCWCGMGGGYVPQWWSGRVTRRGVFDVVLLIGDQT